MHRIYLDYNSTGLLLPEVAAAMAECDRQGYANPASAHAAGRRARRALEDARDRIGEILGAASAGPAVDLVLLTSGGTESNNLAILGLAGGLSAAHRAGRAIVSAIEHPSVMGPAEELRRQGWQIDTLPVDRRGVARLDALQSLLGRDVRFVGLMLANNETGVLQPVREAAALCRAAGVPIHCDAAQAVGRVPVHFHELGVDVLTAAAHKLHGPRGIGLLLARPDLNLQPLLFGGFQQDGIRPGTESPTLAVGFRAALELWHADPAGRQQGLRQLRDALERGLRAGYPGLVVNGGDAPRLPQTSNVSFPGLDRQAVQMALDMVGVDCSTGSACASGSSEPSWVLRAMECEPDVLKGSIRLSVGVPTTAEEVEDAIRRILGVVEDLRAGGWCRNSGRPAPSPAANPV
jgi:cysteine desulfurase